jgi:hypothetical protein
MDGWMDGAWDDIMNEDVRQHASNQPAQISIAACKSWWRQHRGLPRASAASVASGGREQK